MVPLHCRGDPERLRACSAYCRGELAQCCAQRGWDYSINFSEEAPVKRNVALWPASALVASPAFSDDFIVFDRGSTMYVDAEGKNRKVIFRFAPASGTVEILDHETGTEAMVFGRPEF